MMRPKLLVILALLIFGVTGVLDAQNTGTRDKKAEKLFYSALDSYQAGNFDKAMADAVRASEIDPAFADAFILQGDILAEQKQLEKAIEAYRAALKTGVQANPRLYFTIAGIELSRGMYSDALNNFTRFLDFEGIPENTRQKALKGKSSSEYALRCQNAPVPFNPVNMGDSINSQYDEFVNAVAADNSCFYFTRWDSIPGVNSLLVNKFNEDFFVCNQSDSVWLKAVRMEKTLNTRDNEGALALSPDGRFIFFAACNREGGFGSCDIYRSERKGGNWSEPENLGPVVNSPQWDSQPTFSSDGKTLYFASKRPGGKGSSDIWKTELLSDNTWSVPVNLGDNVNTSAEEMAPFIHPDDQTLYFSSKGHQGMGGLDLFLSRKAADHSWQLPVNLGYPINTFADEITLVVNSKGNLAYFSTDKLGGKGRQDIYQFELYPEARPRLTTYFKGIVFDAETSEKLSAKFELIDLATGKTVAEAHSDPIKGDFLLVLTTDRDYAVNVARDGYLFFSDNFSLKGTNTQAEPFVKDIPLQKMKIGHTVVLRNIFFDTDKYELKQESLAELQKLLALLQQNPRLKIEISGHTDNMGSPQHNLVLSENRARAVYDFLVKNNVSSERLGYAGFGLTKPVETNDTETGRAANRRTEFRVVGN